MDWLDSKQATAASELALEELEVWALAGFTGTLPTRWDVIRKECNPKEVYFDPFVRNEAFAGPGGGRKQIMRAAMPQFGSIANRCDEIEALKSSIQAALSAS